MASYAEAGLTPLQRYFKSQPAMHANWHEHLTGLMMLTLVGEVAKVELLVKPDFRKKKLFVNANQPIVRVNFKDGTDATVLAISGGEIVAVNTRLNENVDLVNSDPLGAGHVLFLLPRKLKRKEPDSN